MEGLQTLSQREFEMMKCFWETDHPMRIKELQKQWARGPDPQKWSATFTYANRLVKKGYLYKINADTAFCSISDIGCKGRLLQA